VTSNTGQHDGGQAGCRALRADARRNVARVLEAAEEVFSTQGLAVPIDVVAARAGVGIGTVYRHFPTKEALFKAVVVARLESLLERARQLSTATDAGEAMFTFVGEVAALASEKKDLTDELARAGIDSEELHSTVRDELERAFDVLLCRAQAAGAVRHDITSPEVTALLMGTCMAADMRRGKEPTCRLVAILCDGLRARGEHR
jgi:AcrR family transcriptional regulator